MTELPAPPAERRGWPWDEDETPPSSGGVWPRISVIVPSYRQGAFLEETLRSVLLQGYPDLELMVLDGGSEDDTAAVLRRYESWLSYCTSGPDAGQSDAINRGFERATGELMTFIGSDDVYAPGALRAVARRWSEKPQVGAVIGAFRFLDVDSQWSSLVHPPRIPSDRPLDLALADPADWRLHQVATFYARHALDQVGRRVRSELRHTMDRELLYRVCRCFSVALVDDVLAGFRKHQESKSLSEALAYGREMAELVWLDAPANETPERRRRRRRLSRYWLGRGYLKQAQSTGPGVVRARLLAAAAAHDPQLLLQRHYARRWLETFRHLVV